MEYSDKIDKSSSRESSNIDSPRLYTLERLQVVMNNADFPPFNLKAKQVSCLDNLLLNKDVIAVLPTGFGKSFLFHALPDLFPQKIPGFDNIVIVVCPLNSIIEDQINVLRSRGIPADSLRVRNTENLNTGAVSLFSEEQSETKLEYKMADSVVNGRVKILFSHPEAILSKEGRQLMKSEVYQKRVVAWVVDEAHCIKIWGENFRVNYMELAAVRSFFPDVPLLALTATAPPQTISLLQESLCMGVFKVVKVCPDRKNIYLNKLYRLDSCHSYKSYDRILKPIAYKLLDKKKKYPMTIIYMKLKYCGYAYRLFEEIVGENQYVDGKVHPRCRLFAQFHAPQTDQMKAEILQEMKMETSNIRVIFATSALGMGVDAPGITQVVHIGPPSTLESYLQEIGRAGRHGHDSTADLFFCNSDVSDAKVSKGLVDPSVVAYCQNKTECQRKLLMEYFGFHNVPPQSRCCCICDKSFGKKTEDDDITRKLRTISPDNFERLSCELFKYAQSVHKESLDDEYFLFGQASNMLPSLISDILANIEVIQYETDLLTNFGIWNPIHSSEIFAIICRYSVI